MSAFDPDGNHWSGLWWLIKWGTIAWVIAFGFLACTGQLPSDPG